MKIFSLFVRKAKSSFTLKPYIPLNNVAKLVENNNIYPLTLKGNPLLGQEGPKIVSGPSPNMERERKRERERETERERKGRERERERERERGKREKRKERENRKRERERKREEERGRERILGLKNPTSEYSIQTVKSFVDGCPVKE